MTNQRESEGVPLMIYNFYTKNNVMQNMRKKELGRKLTSTTPLYLGKVRLI